MKSMRQSESVPDEPPDTYLARATAVDPQNNIGDGIYTEQWTLIVITRTDKYNMPYNPIKYACSYALRSTKICSKKIMENFSTYFILN